MRGQNLPCLCRKSQIEKSANFVSLKPTSLLTFLLALMMVQRKQELPLFVISKKGKLS